MYAHFFQNLYRAIKVSKDRGQCTRYNQRNIILITFYDTLLFCRGQCAIFGYTLSDPSSLKYGYFAILILYTVTCYDIYLL